jgi:hypothetical protein
LPFEHVTPRSLNANAVRNFAPEMPGVYGVSNAREWIFIAETGNIRAALLDHLANPANSVMRRKPTGFVFETCGYDRQPGRRESLVREYKPVCNQGA